MKMEETRLAETAGKRVCILLFRPSSWTEFCGVDSQIASIHAAGLLILSSRVLVRSLA